MKADMREEQCNLETVTCLAWRVRSAKTRGSLGGTLSAFVGAVTRR